MNQLNHSRVRRGLTPIHGQLAVGLAFAFAGILAMFALVFNTSLNTREKMQLQTTSDYAALVASNVQRHNLNYIRDLNQAIENEWQITQAALQPPGAPAVSFASMSGVASSSGIEINIATAAASASTFGNVNSGTCETLGEQVDDFWRSRLVENYYEPILLPIFAGLLPELAGRNNLASSIMTAIEQANGLAFDHALDTFLYPQNLPHNLQIELSQRLGNAYTLSSVRSDYQNGLLNNEEYAYEVLDQAREDPLFIPKNEVRNFTYTVFSYTTNNCCVQTPCSCCFGPFISRPGIRLSEARITRDGDYTTQFYTGVRYRPPANIVEKMLNIGVKNPDVSSKEFGQDLDAAGGDIQLFQRRTARNESCIRSQTLRRNISTISNTR